MKSLSAPLATFLGQLNLRPSRTQWIRFGVSLALAILFWGWVTELQDPLTEKTISGVPIGVGELPGSLQVVSTLPSATVTIEGAQSQVRPVSQSDVSVTVDLTGIDAPGTYQRSLMADVPNVNNQSIDPNEVTIQVDERVSELFPLNVTVTNPSDQTRTVGSAEAAVSQVTVTGPTSAVERVAEVILPVTIDRQTESFDETYMPFAVDSDGQRVSEVTILPETILTTVEVETRGKAVSVIPTVTGVPAEGFSVQQRRALPDTIVVDGPTELIDDLLFVNTEPVDVTDANQSISTHVGLADLPEGVTVIEPSGGTIEVRLAIEDISTSSQTLTDLPVEPLGLGEGLTASFQRPTISIQVAAPIDILQAMTPEDISIWADLSGLGPGMHIVTPEVTVPQGATWQTTEPLEISVTIEDVSVASPEPLTPPASPLP
ncbi:MAG: CdaR family protein [Chloroflexota bacterium]|nr:CdaR family protein [Chloroflexota bacterium]